MASNARRPVHLKDIKFLAHTTFSLSTREGTIPIKRRTPMKRLSVLVLVVLLFSSVAPTEASFSNTPASKKKPIETTCELTPLTSQCTVPLIAGQNTYVGEVIIDLAGDPVATFVIDRPDWFITETQLYIDVAPPQKSAPGQFTFQHENLDAQIDEYPFGEVASALGEDCLYVAAHAVVEKRCYGDEGPGDLDGFAAALPDQITYLPADGRPISYMHLSVSDGSALDGAYDAWCVNHDAIMPHDTEITADVYSIYEDLPAGLFIGQEQLDIVNWIINQDFVGKPGGSACGVNYSMWNVQGAIWVTLGQEELYTLGPCSMEIYNLAQANGPGYVPECGEYVAVLLDPVGHGQDVVIWLPLPCDYEVCGEETAWGLADWNDAPGDDVNSCAFPKNTGWGTYFRCCSN
jgi:hypothetical protein